ncbi:MAG TPA: hypothetical protein PK536_03020 [Ignavibacteria bacterium]|nr:hypothetical protein [Bacteroidota bacterium]HRI84400.1 hypothetical protein [Ignavibacteria bacterium]HRK00673.1 hypothetical protein [Ignavibacteria bacterium]
MLSKVLFTIFVTALCGDNHFREHEAKIRKMKMSQMAIKMIIREKESFRNWVEREKAGIGNR